MIGGLHLKTAWNQRLRFVDSLICCNADDEQAINLPLNAAVVDPLNWGKSTKIRA